MSDPVMALGGASHDGYVQIRELDPRGMIALRGDLSDETLRHAVGEITGADLPAPLHAQWSEGRACLWMSPDELLLIVPREELADRIDGLGCALSDSFALVQDMSDARTALRITGSDTREVLSKLTPADMAPGAFPVGMVRRTRLAQIPAAIWMRDDDSAEILCFRSVARYAYDLFCKASEPASRIGLA